MKKNIINQDLKLCACGCGELIRQFDNRGRPRKFKRFHASKLENNASWHGGHTKCRNYIRILQKDHPRADKDGYVMQHVIIYEHYLKILFDEDLYIPKKYHIHHIIPIKKGGTNALINLTCLHISEHMRLHIKKDMSNRYCFVCNSSTTSIDKNGNPHWYRYNYTDDKESFICQNCYHKDRRKNGLGW